MLERRGSRSGSLKNVADARSKARIAAGATVVSSSYIERLKKVAAEPVSGAPKGSRTMRTTVKVDPMRKTRIRDLDFTRREKEAARIASIGVNFDPLDPALDDIFDKAEHVTPAMQAARSNTTYQTDEIKGLQVKVNAARAAVQREKQIQARKAREAKEREAERAIDEAMERERVAAIERDNEAARRRKEAARQFGAERKAQLEQRDLARVLDEEAKIVEGEQLKRTFQVQEEAEARKAAAKVEVNRKRAAELKAANIKAMAKREKEKEEEAARDQEALRWMMLKAEEERAWHEEQEHVKKEKALIAAKLLAEQERAMDTRGEEDAARALRHQEARELAERREVREREERRRRMQAECEVARKAQQELKAAQRRAEREEDETMVAASVRAAAEAADALDRAAEEAAAARRANAAGVKAQVAEKAAKRREEESYRYKERQEAMLAEAMRARRIAAVRSDMKTQLYKEGVDDTLQAKAKI